MMGKDVIRLLSAAGLVVLLLCCAACSGGKPSATPTDALTPTDAPAETVTAEDAAFAPVEEYPAAYALTCQLTEADGGDALEGWKNDDPSRSYFQPVLMRAAASSLPEGETVFDILIRCEETKANLRHTFAGQLLAKKGDAWLFALRDPGLSDTYYLYRTVSGSLMPLGRDVTVALCGDAIFVLPASDGSYSPRTLTVFSWKGKKMREFTDITDMRRYEGALYLLSEFSDYALERLDPAVCTAPDGTLTPERICEFPGYRVEFIANTQDALFLYPRSGRKIVTCNITGAAACMAALKNGNSLPAEALSARCDLFTVVLPESWLGKYVCETTSTGVTFYHKASREAGMNGYLFSLYAVPASDAERYVYEAQAVANYNDNGDLRCILLGGPGDVQYAPEYEEEYSAMQRDRFYVVRTISMVHPYSETWLNYQGFQWGVFRGTDGAGSVYTFTPQLITNRSAEGEISFAACGEAAARSVPCYAEMADGAGELTWFGETATGGGKLTVKNDTTLLLTLTDLPDGWTGAAGEEITLTALR